MVYHLRQLASTYRKEVIDILSNNNESKIKAYWVTTPDNPYNPFSEFSKWYVYDIMYKGNVCATIARLANVSTELPEDEYTETINKAIERFFELGLGEDYIRVEAPNE